MSLEQWGDSDCWSPIWNMPLCPKLNNPWIYSAYAQRMTFPFCPIKSDDVIAYYIACESEYGSRLFNRWPDAHGGNSSHDEIMGAAYMSLSIAQLTLKQLDSTWGYWNPQNEPGSWFRHNVYRFVFLRPFLQAAANEPVGIIGQLLWSAHILLDALTRKPGDAGGALRNWLMMPMMVSYAPCRWATRFWKRRVQKIMTPKQAFALEPREYPIYAAMAPEAW